MADIVTSRIFADGEKNITAAKLNDIVGSSVIQPAFVSAKPSTSTVAPTDNLLVLTAAGGTYAKAPFQTIIDSVNANLNTNAAIWSVRLRSFNAIGNPTFEVDQRTAGAGVVISGTTAFGCDRWRTQLGGTMVATAQQIVSNTAVQGTNFWISHQIFRITLTTAQASLGVNDFLEFWQHIEGPQLRELYNDVHSISILVRSSIPNLTFGISLTDPTGTRALGKLCTTSATPNTWTLIPLANLPAFPPAGTFGLNPGAAGYVLNVCLAGGTSRVMPANDTWQSTSAFIPAGIDNFASKPVNSTFDVAYISHEPGSLASNPPMDSSFRDNYEACQRYFQKSVPYGSLPLSGTSQHIVGCLVATTVATTAVRPAVAFKKTLAKPPTAILQYNGVANTAYLETIGSAGVGSVTASDSEITGITLASAQTVAANNIPNLFGGWYADTGW